MRVTVPSFGARTACSIFIASTRTSVSPFLTVAPTAVRTPQDAAGHGGLERGRVLGTVGSPLRKAGNGRQAIRLAPVGHLRDFALAYGRRAGRHVRARRLALLPGPEIAQPHAPPPIRNRVSNGPGQELFVLPGAAEAGPERTEAAAAKTS